MAYEFGSAHHTCETCVIASPQPIVDASNHQGEAMWNTTEILPDDMTTVLIYVPDDNEPVWLGYCEDGRWFLIEGRECQPSHWCLVPAPPNNGVSRNDQVLLSTLPRT